MPSSIYEIEESIVYKELLEAYKMQLLDKQKRSKYRKDNAEQIAIDKLRKEKLLRKLKTSRENL